MVCIIFVEVLIGPGNFYLSDNFFSCILDCYSDQTLPSSTLVSWKFQKDGVVIFLRRISLVT